MALDIADLEFTERGIRIKIWKEKQYQDGKGRTVGVPLGRTELCPVRAVIDWILARGVEPGPLFTHTGHLKPTALRRRIAELPVLQPRGCEGEIPSRYNQDWIDAYPATAAELKDLITRTMAIAQGTGAEFPGGRLHHTFLYRVLRREVARIGLDPKLYGGHSTRAGFITMAVDAGVTELQIAQHTGHRSLSTLRTYYRSRDVFRGNACNAIGM